MNRSLADHARELVGEAAVATSGAPNEASLRHELESALERHCRALGIPWTPFRLDYTLRTSNGSGRRFVDVAHGAVIIEYEAPRSFGAREGGQLEHARGQAQEYAELLHHQEGRALADYVLLAWDGSHISFGRHGDGGPQWRRLTTFGVAAAERLLGHLRDDGVPLVHPLLLSALVGPESETGAKAIPKLFRAVEAAVSPRARRTTKTKLLFVEWKRLFAQVVGVQTEHLQRLLAEQGEAHQQPYGSAPAEYLFALNTHIALVAKLVAALSLPGGSQDLADPTGPIRTRIEALESGRLFADAGVSNMLVGDFFSWYVDDPSWDRIAPAIDRLVAQLTAVSFDVTRKSPDSTRDLFKGMYQSFVPRALRHALGEYYTPDWLAAHALDTLEWQPGEDLLDPTCGSGTFLLEALRRRLCANAGPRPSAGRLLTGLYGIDLNPLAVLSARASLVVFLSPYLSAREPVRLPVYLADAINTAFPEDALYRHRLQTELGPLSFAIPKRLVERPRFYDTFHRIRELVDSGYDAASIHEAVAAEFGLDYLTCDEQEALRTTLDTLASMHANGWNGIWCMVLADRFAAAAIPRVRFIAGNPPWVKWSHLPPEYAEFIKDRCLALGVFSEDRWVGGIESDISTVITYEAMDKWLDSDGKLGFFITGTVFANESSQGFRRFRVQHRDLVCKVLEVQDFDEVAPFEGVSNHATLLIVARDGATAYPIPYRIWTPPVIDGCPKRCFDGADEFRRTASCRELLAAPVPGTDAGPWLKGTREEHKIWERVFGPSAPAYRARKGVTADRNGIFFVEVLSRGGSADTCVIRNDPNVGRTGGIQQVRATVEKKHVFPLLRGRGVTAFSAVPDAQYRILVPQRGMHGDPNLPTSAPRTHRFLRRFRDELMRRSSYRRFQQGKPWWSIWSTGKYTFSRFKVVWREMSGGRFAAAYVGSHRDKIVGTRVVIPDHKVYFVPVRTEQEAAYLTAVLNAPTVAGAISAYAAQLSLGVSVVEYLRIPPFSPGNRTHRKLAQLATDITRRASDPTSEELETIDRAARRLFGLT